MVGAAVGVLTRHPYGVVAHDWSAVHAAFHESFDMREHPLPVQFAEGVARCAEGRTADEAAARVAGGLELRAAFLADALDIAHREEPVEAIVRSKQFREIRPNPRP